jgi:hypothetical protein
MTRSQITRQSRGVAYAAVFFAVIYAVYKVWFGITGQLGLPGGPPVPADYVARIGNVTVAQLGNAGLAILAAGVALATVTCWGRVIPRWILASACWLAGLMFTLGVISVVVQLASYRLTAWSVVDLVVVCGLAGGFLSTAFCYQRRAYPNLKVRLWPAAGYAAIGWTAGYGLLKLYWSLGGDLLLAQAPLTGDMRKLALTHDPVFDFWGLWVTVGLAVIGILVVVAILSRRFRWVPRWILITGAAIATAMLLFRGVTGVVGDGLHLAGIAQRPADPLLLELMKWDFGLWAPYFLIWGLLWTAVLWRASRPGVLSSADGVAYA